MPATASVLIAKAFATAGSKQDGKGLVDAVTGGLELPSGSQESVPHGAGVEIREIPGPASAAIAAQRSNLRA